MKRVAGHYQEHRFLLNIHNTSVIFCCDLQQETNGDRFDYYWSIGTTMASHHKYRTGGTHGPKDIVQAAKVLKKALFFEYGYGDPGRNKVVDVSVDPWFWRLLGVKEQEISAHPPKAAILGNPA
jgi:hypothetical protein